MKGKIENIFVGLIFLGMIWLVLMIIISEAGKVGMGLITECEKDLPRNQTCILMAVPEEVEK